MKYGIRKRTHPIKKNRLPNIAQKLPMLEIINPTAEITKVTQPMSVKLIFDKGRFKKISFLNKFPLNHQELLSKLYDV
jgi:hypothetical protein